MNLKDYIVDLPNGFKSLELPQGFNSPLYCRNNNLSELILPVGFNSLLSCSNNNLTQLILPEGFDSGLYCDKSVKVYFWNEWVALERERKINQILMD